MSVMVETSLGEFVIDLFSDRCPLTCKNFLKLCKIKYYNGCLFHTVQKDFTAQTGDPTGTGSGGDSIYRFLYGDQARFFNDEIYPGVKHTKMGTVAMASAGENLNASQFYITLRDDLDYLDEKHTVFGEVAEGLETLTRINEAYLDEKGRPYKNIRIKHTYVLDDPFEDPPLLTDLIPDASPEGIPREEVVDDVRLEDDWEPMDEQLAPEDLVEAIRTKEAHSRAVVLESIGDIPDADVKPPDNVLFVCKLNPVTEDEDLHTIFSRFGTVTSAEVIRDFKTGDSLCYAFIEFESNEACEQAYFKMDNALIDDRRIKVDFSQSVSKLWNQFRRKGTQGRGCFKCGALDHVAKDCPIGETPGQHQKYVLKENNQQHGGDKDSGYEMVFDDDGGSPQREKRQLDNEQDSRKKHKSDRRGYGEDIHKSYRNKDSRDSDRRSHKNDEHNGHGSQRENSHGRDDRDKEKGNVRDYRDKEKGHRRDDRDKEKGHRRDDKDKDNGNRRDYRVKEKGHGRDDGEKERGHDGRDDRDRRESRYGGRSEQEHRERRNDGDYRKKNADIDRLDKRNDGFSRNKDRRDLDDVPNIKKEEQNHGRRSSRDYYAHGSDDRRQGDRR
ncbi:hypothetical protein SOVF_078420 [Spinacia oleracea]|uniref:Peptidyl-prolyl cis-trans isomerase n=1 Tax=Spinacia oleracea TaxID=3562 RepID=A0A9R0HVD0_SPIOL|nr:peptidyl-prolyl cis-trans isomerase CYP59-like [Spinacia oleracea]XP_021837752.2 peptidyl-prolyl cis-trans isomerase CYP59-like [Spinacia oleracea]KNA17630.1 hypothetical protein SOVF_078420 [Spinacia oleracea]